MLHDAPNKSSIKSNDKSSGCEKNQLLLFDLSESETELCEMRDQLQGTENCSVNPQQLRRIAEDLRTLRVKLKEAVAHVMPKAKQKLSRSHWKKDWELFGVLLDRIFGLMYIAFVIVSFVCFFPRPL